MSNIVGNIGYIMANAVACVSQKMHTETSNMFGLKKMFKLSLNCYLVSINCIKKIKHKKTRQDKTKCLLY